jgi:small conductance mechanosensitive channel
MPGPSPLTLEQFWQQQLLQGGINLGKAVLVLALGWLAVGLLMRMLTGGLRRTALDATLAGFLGSLAYVLLLVVVIVAALGELGIQTASLVAVLGAGGLSLALAFQASLSNLASGIMILLFKLFRVGDRVEAAGQSGRVAEIQIFHTILTNGAGERIIIPNGAITGAAFKHWPAGSQPEPPREQAP